MNEFNVDGVSIPFENNVQSIAISLSGGADSALLAYLLCEHIESNKLPIDVFIISHIRMWKTRPWQKYNQLDTYGWLCRRFRTIHFTRYENFIPPDIEWGDKGATLIDEYGKESSGDIIEIRAFAEYICHQEDIDVYYNAVTRNPRNTDFKGMAKRDIEPTEDNKHLRLMTHMGRIAVHPFRFIEKSWVIKQYVDKNIIDLLNNTRSCEGEFDGVNYITFNVGDYVPLCNTCFWCKEREWALKQNDL
jgi:hypothetical protein